MHIIIHIEENNPMNWQVIGQVITATLVIVSGPLIIFIAKKADL